MSKESRLCSRDSRRLDLYTPVRASGIPANDQRNPGDHPNSAGLCCRTFSRMRATRLAMFSWPVSFVLRAVTTSRLPLSASYLSSVIPSKRCKTRSTRLMAFYTVRRLGTLIPILRDG